MARAVKRGAVRLWWLIGLVLVLLLRTPGKAVATIINVLYGTPGGGTCKQMRLTVDQNTGHATLTNVTASALNVDVYEIWSAAGKLTPTGWVSIGDAAAADPTAVSAALGPGSLSFGDLLHTTGLLSEGSLMGYATFQPGQAWDIGQVVEPGTPGGDMTFYYTRPTAPGTKYLGELVVTPEPASVVIFSAIVMGAALGSRRRASQA